MLVLSRDDVARAVSMAEAIDLMASAFSQLARGAARVPLRTAVEVEREQGVLLTMPALLTESGDLAVKLVSVFPGNPARGKPTVTAAVVVHDAETGEAVALLEGSYLTALRTGAASGLATRLLARPDSSVVALFGAGGQARAQLEAVRAAVPVREVRVYTPSGESARALAREYEGALAASAATDPAEAVRGADVVVTVTTSAVPVFDGRDLAPGAHLNLVGAFTPDAREADDAAISAARVVVDSRAACLAEAGDVLQPLRAGLLAADALDELGEVAAGLRPGRRDERERTVFKSVGSAVQDAAVAGHVVRRARELGLGAEIEL